MQKERMIETPGQALNVLNDALAFVSKGESFVGLKLTRKILLKAYVEVLKEVQDGHNKTKIHSEISAGD